MHKVFGLPTSILHENDWHDVGKKTSELFHDDTIETIIIDEISMVRADVFVTVDQKLRHIKCVDEPFGGLQIIMIGDFFQLSPVVTRNEKRAFNKLYKSPFCFTTDSWKDLNIEVINLDQVMRQKDATTIKALNYLRQGEKVAKVVAWLNKSCPTIPDEADITTLCIKNDIAAEINERFYNMIDEKEFIFAGSTEGTFKQRHPVDEQLHLKNGCRIVFFANYTETEDLTRKPIPELSYVNGESGIIISCEETPIQVQKDNGDVVRVHSHPWEEFDYEVSNKKLSKKLRGTYTQLPLKLGYAMTIHKAQGLTLTKYILDLGDKAFAHGQAYVGLTRIIDIKNLVLFRPLRPNDIIIDREVIEFYKSL